MKRGLNTRRLLYVEKIVHRLTSLKSSGPEADLIRGVYCITLSNDNDWLHC